MTSIEATPDYFASMIHSKSTRRLKSIETLMKGTVDYAGLFPPASQDMRTAVHSYADYFSGPDAYALGRFIVPVTRLGEFEESAKDLLPSGGSKPWTLSVLIGGDVSSAADQLIRFNDRHASNSPVGHAVIEIVELKANSVDDIATQAQAIPQSFQAYFEIPLQTDVQKVVDAIARAGARAKVRTGGVTRDSFPTASELVEFMIACKRAGIRFKATAGLHHPVRGSYPLSYDEKSEASTMFGYLNLFVAAALIERGESAQRAVDALEETDESAFHFSDDGLRWRDVVFSTEELGAMRETFANSFGSCSFREPVDELRELTHKS